MCDDLTLSSGVFMKAYVHHCPPENVLCLDSQFRCVHEGLRPPLSTRQCPVPWLSVQVCSWRPMSTTVHQTMSCALTLSSGVFMKAYVHHCPPENVLCLDSQYRCVHEGLCPPLSTRQCLVPWLSVQVCSWRPMSSIAHQRMYCPLTLSSGVFMKAYVHHCPPDNVLYLDSQFRCVHEGLCPVLSTRQCLVPWLSVQVCSWRPMSTTVHQTMSCALTLSSGVFMKAYVHHCPPDNVLCLDSQFRCVHEGLCPPLSTRQCLVPWLSVQVCSWRPMSTIVHQTMSCALTLSSGVFMKAYVHHCPPDNVLYLDSQFRCVHEGLRPPLSTRQCLVPWLSVQVCSWRPMSTTVHQTMSCTLTLSSGVFMKAYVHHCPPDNVLCLDSQFRCVHEGLCPPLSTRQCLVPWLSVQACSWRPMSTIVHQTMSCTLTLSSGVFMKAYVHHCPPDNVLCLDSQFRCVHEGLCPPLSTRQCLVPWLSVQVCSWRPMSTIVHQTMSCTLTLSSGVFMKAYVHHCPPDNVLCLDSQFRCVHEGLCPPLSTRQCPVPWLSVQVCSWRPMSITVHQTMSCALTLSSGVFMKAYVHHCPPDNVLCLDSQFRRVHEGLCPPLSTRQCLVPWLSVQVCSWRPMSTTVHQTMSCALTLSSGVFMKAYVQYCPLDNVLSLDSQSRCVHEGLCPVLSTRECLVPWLSVQVCSWRPMSTTVHQTMSCPLTLSPGVFMKAYVQYCPLDNVLSLDSQSRCVHEGLCPPLSTRQCLVPWLSVQVCSWRPTSTIVHQRMSCALTLSSGVFMKAYVYHCPPDNVLCLDSQFRCVHEGLCPPLSTRECPVPWLSVQACSWRPMSTTVHQTMSCALTLSSGVFMKAYVHHCPPDNVLYLDSQSRCVHEGLCLPLSTRQCLVPWLSVQVCSWRPTSTTVHQTMSCALTLSSGVFMKAYVHHCPPDNVLCLDSQFRRVHEGLCPVLSTRQCLVPWLSVQVCSWRPMSTTVHQTMSCALTLSSGVFMKAYVHHCPPENVLCLDSQFRCVHEGLCPPLSTRQCLVPWLSVQVCSWRPMSSIVH